MTKENVMNELQKYCPNWPNWNHHEISVMLDKLEILGLIKFDQPKSKVDLIIEAWKARRNDIDCWRDMAEIAIRVLEQK